MDSFILAALLIALTICLVSVSLYQLRPRRDRDTPSPTPEIDPAEAEAFTAELIAALETRAAPGRVESTAVDQLRFKVVFDSGTPGQGEILVPLDKLYLDCKAQPEAREDLIDAFLRGLLDMLSKASSPLTWGEARGLVMPQLANPSVASSEGVPAFPYGHELEVRLVLPSPLRTVEVTWAHLDAWGISAEQARRSAQRNLVASSEAVPLVEHHEGEANTLYVYESRDGFDAARILLDERWRELADRHTERIFIAIPSRDFLIAFTDTNAEHLALIRERVFDDWMGDEASRLTWKLFEATRNGVQPHETTLH